MPPSAQIAHKGFEETARIVDEDHGHASLKSPEHAAELAHRGEHAGHAGGQQGESSPLHTLLHGPASHVASQNPAKLAVNPWTKFRDPTAPISPLQKKPAIGISPQRRFT